jgi:hypothetical protein
VHVFEAALFSLLGTAAAAGPPSTGTLETGGYSGPQTQCIETKLLLAYISGVNCTWSLRAMATKLASAVMLLSGQLPGHGVPAATIAATRAESSKNSFYILYAV